MLLLCVVMACLKSTSQTTTIALGPSEGVADGSKVFHWLHQASTVVRAVITDGRLGYLDDPSSLGDEFLAAAYRQINDANRELLRLEPGDEQGLESALQSYVSGSNFIASLLLGHSIEPSTVPGTFFGQWGFVPKYHGATPTMPWYVVATAFAWMRCAAGMWIQFPSNEHLAQEVWTTLAEFAHASGNSSLIERLANTPNEELRLSIGHLLGMQNPRNAFDQLLQETLQWAANRVAPNLPQYELDLMERSQKTLLEQMLSSTESMPSPDMLSGLECIGPMRMAARLAHTGLVPTNETHAAALAELHDQILKGMKRFILASEGAQEMNEILAQHREDVWRGNVGMLPVARVNRALRSVKAPRLIRHPP